MGGFASWSRTTVTLPSTMPPRLVVTLNVPPPAEKSVPYGASRDTNMPLAVVSVVSIRPRRSADRYSTVPAVDGTVKLAAGVSCSSTTMPIVRPSVGNTLALMAARTSCSVDFDSRTPWMSTGSAPAVSAWHASVTVACASSSSTATHADDVNSRSTSADHTGGGPTTVRWSGRSALDASSKPVAVGVGSPVATVRRLPWSTLTETRVSKSITVELTVVVPGPLQVSALIDAVSVQPSTTWTSSSPGC